MIRHIFKLVIILGLIICFVFIKTNNFFVKKEISGVSTTTTTAPNKELIIETDKTNEKPVNKEKYYAPVLAYHHIAPRQSQNSYYVSPVIFDQQLTWLEDNDYTVISMDKFYEAASNDGTLPEKPIVLTFDDGNPDNYTNAFPILKKHNMTGTFFIKLNNIQNEGKGMTWDKLKEMSDAGMTIGSHTINHDNLTNLDDQSLYREVAESKNIIEKHLGITIKYFSYPGGAYSDKVIFELKDAGYLMAFTSKHKVYQQITDDNSFYKIPRVHIDDEMPSFIDWIQGINLY